MVIYISAGQGVGQWRKITNYVGATRVATIAPNWTTNPNNTSDYTVYSIANVVAGVRTKTVTINKEPIDVTTDDENGWRTLLDRPSVRSVDISVEGVTKDDSLKAAMLGSETSHVLNVVAVEYADGSMAIGKFHFTSLEDSGEYTDAVQFSASLQSSGPVTFVAAP
jgi:TP901-1 family phage major tail protein